MRLRTVPDLRLTDYRDGRLESPATGGSVAASAAHREIASFFREAADWKSYPAATKKEAIAARDHLLAAGLVLPAEAADPLELTLTGPTMFGVPRRYPHQLASGEIVFLGAPFDIGTTGYPGARFGPAALRDASVERYECQLDIATGRMFGWNVPSLGGSVLGGARICDLGDLPYRAGEHAQDYYDRLRWLVDSIVAEGAFPVVLGGDHSITYATHNREAEVLIHLDAHCDLADLVPGHSHHHGNVLSRLVEEGGGPEIHHFGLRDTGGWDTLTAGTFAKSVGDLERDGWSNAIAGRSSFVSLDLDVLDPSVLPGTGTPVVGGLTLRQLCQVLVQVAVQTRPLGLDVVELCPLRDPSGRSERAAIEAILSFLAHLHRHHLQQPTA